MVIESVAIVGGGPSGLTTLIELLNTPNAEGNETSTIYNYFNNNENKLKNPAFKKIILFERNDSLGGIWNYSEKPDPALPKQDLINSGNYNDPYKLAPIHESIPSEEILKKTSVTSPFERQFNDERTIWDKSAAYTNLFTNIPAPLTRFSYLKQISTSEDKNLNPFLKHTELKKYLTSFVSNNNNNNNIKGDELTKNHIRTRTSVEKAERKKINGVFKWVLYLREYSDNNGKKLEKWYTEYYDALICASGHYSVPNFPIIRGFSEFNQKYPGTILHSKHYRDGSSFVNKNVLIVGHSLTAVDIIQEIFKTAKSVTISRRSNNFFYPWLERASSSEGIINKPGLKELNVKNGTVIFNDGTEEKYDKIILATGYHWHYPYIKDYVSITSDQKTVSSGSRISDLYLHVFSIKEPTLAFVGVPVTPLKWGSIESEAAAVAGVFSGAKKLPDTDTQIKYEKERLAETQNNCYYHVYSQYDVESGLINKLKEYFVRGRKSPLEFEPDYIEQLAKGAEASEELFYISKRYGAPKL